MTMIKTTTTPQSLSALLTQMEKSPAGEKSEHLTAVVDKALVQLKNKQLEMPMTDLIKRLCDTAKCNDATLKTQAVAAVVNLAARTITETQDHSYAPVALKGLLDVAESGKDKKLAAGVMYKAFDLAGFTYADNAMPVLVDRFKKASEENKYLYLMPLEDKLLHMAHDAKDSWGQNVLSYLVNPDKMNDRNLVIELRDMAYRLACRMNEQGKKPKETIDLYRIHLHLVASVTHEDTANSMMKRVEKLADYLPADQALARMKEKFDTADVKYKNRFLKTMSTRAVNACAQKNFAAPQDILSAMVAAHKAKEGNWMIADHAYPLAMAMYEHGAQPKNAEVVLEALLSAGESVTDDIKSAQYFEKAKKLSVLMPTDKVMPVLHKKFNDSLLENKFQFVDLLTTKAVNATLENASQNGLEKASEWPQKTVALYVDAMALPDDDLFTDLAEGLYPIANAMAENRDDYGMANQVFLRLLKMGLTENNEDRSTTLLEQAGKLYDVLDQDQKFQPETGTAMAQIALEGVALTEDHRYGHALYYLNHLATKKNVFSLNAAELAPAIAQSYQACLQKAEPLVEDVDFAAWQKAQGEKLQVAYLVLNLC